MSGLRERSTLWRNSYLHLSDWTILAGCFGGRGSLGCMFGRFLSIFLCHFFCLHAYRLGPSKACTGRALRAFGVEQARLDELKRRLDMPHRCLCALTGKFPAVKAEAAPGLDDGCKAPLATLLAEANVQCEKHALGGQAVCSIGQGQPIGPGQPPLLPVIRPALVLHDVTREMLLTTVDPLR